MMRSISFHFFILFSLFGCSGEVKQILLTPNSPRKIRIEDIPVDQNDFRFTNFAAHLHPEVSGADSYDLRIEADVIASRKQALFGLEGWTVTEPMETDNPGNFFTHGGFSDGTVVRAWFEHRLFWGTKYRYDLYAVAPSDEETFAPQRTRTLIRSIQIDLRKPPVP